MAARKALGLLLGLTSKPKPRPKADDYDDEEGNDEHDFDDEELDDEAEPEPMKPSLRDAYERFCDAKDERDYDAMNEALDDILEEKGLA